MAFTPVQPQPRLPALHMQVPGHLDPAILMAQCAMPQGVGRQFVDRQGQHFGRDRKSTRLNSSHSQISYAVFCLKKKKNTQTDSLRTWPLTNRDYIHQLACSPLSVTMA